jgi:hypothetical protein
MYALRLALLDANFSGLFALPRGELRVGVRTRDVGVVARPAGLHGRCSGLRFLPFETDFVLNGEFARLDGILEESEELLSLFDDTGNRDECCTAGALGGIKAWKKGWTPFIVFTLVSAKSL